MKIPFTLIIVALLVSGCAATKNLSNSEKNNLFSEYLTTEKLESVNEIRSFRFDRWRSLSNRYLVITTSPKNHYLLKLRNNCPNLTFTNTLVINQSISSVLSINFDSIAPLESPQFKCHIGEIYKLSKEQMAELETLKQPPTEDA